jgi:hypothetical protein
MPVKRKSRTKRAIKSYPVMVEWPDIAKTIEQLHTGSVERTVNDGDFSLSPVSLEPKKSLWYYGLYAGITLFVLSVIAAIIISLFPHLLF